MHKPFLQCTPIAHIFLFESPLSLLQDLVLVASHYRFLRFTFRVSKRFGLRLNARLLPFLLSL